MRNAEDQHKLDEHTKAQSPVRDVELGLSASSGDILETILTTEATEMSGEPCLLRSFAT